MKINQSMLTKSACYQANRKITVKGLMLHSVGCPQPRASAFIRSWNNSNTNACVHAFIEANGNVYQTLPWNHRGWHCGSGGNNTHIGVEMTEPSTIRYTGCSSWVETGSGATTKSHVLGTYQTAVELFAHLCRQYNLNPLADGVIVSHKEGCSRGIATNHGDPEHIWSKFGLTMDKFRKDIKDKMSGHTPDSNTTPFKVRIQIKDLNIRSGPGTNYRVTGAFTGVGVFTVVQVTSGTGSHTGWGKLKSGAGWIALDYAQRI